MKEVNKRQGYVYVLENENGLIKVSTSIHPWFREYQIVSTSGYSMEKRYQTSLCWNPYKIEASAHKMLQSKNKMGEWFLCTFKEATAAVGTAYDLLAVTKHDAPEPNYDWIEQLVCDFCIRPYYPDYGPSGEDRIYKLEDFLGAKVDSLYFASLLDLWEELEESDEVNSLISKYPNLANGIDDPEEIKRLVLETYIDLHHSALCPRL